MWNSGILINHAKILKDEIDDKWSPILKVLVQAAFCFISQKDVNGYYDFQNLVENIELYVNGESIPTCPLEIDVRTNRNYVTPFVSLFEVAEKWNKDGFEITRSQFRKGYDIYAFSWVPSNLIE